MNIAVTIGTASTPVVPANPKRRLLILGNNSNEDMYIALGGTATTGGGIPLKGSGGSIVLEKTRPGDIIFQGNVSGICASGGKVLSVSEVDDGN